MTADAIAGTRDFLRDDLSGWRTVRAGSWRWLLRPDVSETWQDHPALNLADASLASGTVIKRGPHRTVRRLEIADGEFYVKQFHHPDWRTRFRHLLRSSQARWEWSRYRLAVHHDLPTADVVAIGQDTAWGGESGLITRGLSGAEPLDQWVIDHAACWNTSLRRRITEHLGRLVGRMHRQGVTHLDFHAGNILVRQDADALQAWIVDLSPLRFRPRPAGLAEIGQNLGRLRHSLLPQLNRTDEAAFFDAYWDELESLDRRVGCAHQDSETRWAQPTRQERANRQAAMRELSRQCDAVARVCWEQMDRKWARGNRKTILIDVPNAHCRGLAELGRAALMQLCESPERLLSLPTGARVRLADRTLLLTSSGADSGWARRGWEVGHALQRRLIAAPVPACMLEHHQPNGIQELLAVSEEPDWQPLTAMFSTERPSLPPANLREIGNCVADLLQRFHDLGFIHVRLTLAALETQQDGGSWQVRWASLDEIRQAGHVSGQRRRKELRSLTADVSAQTVISRTQWLRWLKRYSRGSELSHWKAEWIAVSVRSSESATRRAA